MGVRLVSRGELFVPCGMLPIEMLRNQTRIVGFVNHYSSFVGNNNDSDGRVKILLISSNGFANEALKLFTK